MKARGVVWLLPLLSSCGDVFDGERACTAVGCALPFSITAVASEGLPDGDYELQLMLDETRITCSHPALVASPQPAGTCTGQSVRSNVAVHNGGASGTGRANAFLIDIDDTPSRVVLRVLHAGELIVEASYEPVYSTSMPNGPECGPTCTSAPHEELRLDFDS